MPLYIAHNSSLHMVVMVGVVVVMGVGVGVGCIKTLCM